MAPGDICPQLSVACLVLLTSCLSVVHCRQLLALTPPPLSGAPAVISWAFPRASLTDFHPQGRGLVLGDCKELGFRNWVFLNNFYLVFFKRFIFMCVDVLPTCMYVHGCQVLWNWSSGQLGAAMWVQGIEPGCPARAPSACWNC